jgi:hypothetical protein
MALLPADSQSHFQIIQCFANFPLFPVRTEPEAFRVWGRLAKTRVSTVAHSLYSLDLDVSLVLGT